MLLRHQTGYLCRLLPFPLWPNMTGMILGLSLAGFLRAAVAAAAALRVGQQSIRGIDSAEFPRCPLGLIWISCSVQRSFYEQCLFIFFLPCARQSVPQTSLMFPAGPVLAARTSLIVDNFADGVVSTLLWSQSQQASCASV